MKAIDLGRLGPPHKSIATPVDLPADMTGQDALVHALRESRRMAVGVGAAYIVGTIDAALERAGLRVEQCPRNPRCTKKPRHRGMCYPASRVPR